MRDISSDNPQIDIAYYKEVAEHYEEILESIGNDIGGYLYAFDLPNINKAHFILEKAARLIDQGLSKRDFKVFRDVETGKFDSPSDSK